MKPYEDEQFNMMMPSAKIERMPMLVNPTDGQILSQFQKFYDTVVDSLTKNQWRKLYLISDRLLEGEQFGEFYRERIGVKLQKILSHSEPHYKMDIQLNMERFKSSFRSILGSFIVSVMYLYESDMIEIRQMNVEFKRLQTEIFFTYRNGEFQVISSFNTLSELED